MSNLIRFSWFGLFESQIYDRMNNVEIEFSLSWK